MQNSPVSSTKAPGFTPKGKRRVYSNYCTLNFKEVALKEKQNKSKQKITFLIFQNNEIPCFTSIVFKKC